jgi:2Fe-2S ferredoxin
MARITYIEFDGTAHTVDVKTGNSVMEGAVKNNIPGIDADCGGACACATCHVYVDPAWQAAVGERTDMEESMLDFAENVADNSRLSCQIKVTDALDGLVVRMPESQHYPLPRSSRPPGPDPGAGMSGGEAVRTAAPDGRRLPGPVRGRGR